MGLDWSTVRRAHIQEACEYLIHAGQGRVGQRTGLVLRHGSTTLSAKAVVRLAYCLANGLPLDAPLKFASGEGTLALLRSHGFEAERLGQTD